MSSLKIDRNISQAATLPSDFYRDPGYYEMSKERIFARSWQLLIDSAQVKAPGHAVPVTLLEGCLNEPLLITRDTQDNINCLSNVCTHRGNLLIEAECHSQSLRCRYHGRRFGLDGKYLSAPGFDDAKNFPTENDSLSHVPNRSWKNFIFATCNANSPLFPFEDWIADVEKRVGFLPLEEFRFDPNRSRSYIVNANWALYCDNYLEGLHIPYVHPDLAVTMDTSNYKTEVFPYSVLQIGIANKGHDKFDLPKDHLDFGKDVSAYFYWLFPNLMLNFYPWGLSINIVSPLGPERTRIVYLTYVYDEEKIAISAGAADDRVEREDEDIVEKVQKGIKSRFYRQGRYSPQWEKGVHQFHRLLTEYLG